MKRNWKCSVQKTLRSFIES